MAYANSADPDQTAPEGLSQDCFAILPRILRNKWTEKQNVWKKKKKKKKKSMEKSVWLVDLEFNGQVNSILKAMSAGQLT